MEYNDHLLKYSADDERFTTRGNALYPILLNWQQGEQFVFRCLDSDEAGQFQLAEMLATNEAVSLRQSRIRLVVSLPKTSRVDTPMW
jgi:hypothetical protein